MLSSGGPCFFIGRGSPLGPAPSGGLLPNGSINEALSPFGPWTVAEAETEGTTETGQPPEGVVAGGFTTVGGGGTGRAAATGAGGASASAGGMGDLRASGATGATDAAAHRQTPKLFPFGLQTWPPGQAPIPTQATNSPGVQVRAEKRQPASSATREAQPSKLDLIGDPVR